MHGFKRADRCVLAEPTLFAGRSRGYTQTALVDDSSGSVHTGLSVNELAAGGSIATHLHSFEESFYILSGRAAIAGARGGPAIVGPGDFGVFKVGTPHEWQAEGAEPVRWLQMAAPQPKPAGKERDTFFAGPRWNETRRAGDELDRHLLGHFDAGDIPPEDARAPGLAKGVFLKWMIDEAFGARHHRLLFIEYQPGASIALHDHTFEEAYFILSGQVEATLDGERYQLQAGDVVWTAVGCVHAFANTGSTPVRWLETFSPQPPSENVFRFMGEWAKRAAEVEQ